MAAAVPTGYILFNSDASKSFTLEDEDGMYYKVIEMFYKANQMGILDPIPARRALMS